MSRRVAILSLLFVALASGGLVPVPAAAQAAPFTIVVLPDTQSYLDSAHPGRAFQFADQIEWAIAQRWSRNIVFVSHVGDVVENSQSTTEWNWARPIFDRLRDSGLPFGVAPGNHDLRYDATSPAYDAVLPASRFADDSWYRGGFDNNRNSYQVVSHGGDDLLFLHVRYLRYASIDATLAWARDVLAAHPAHLAFVTTHEFGGADGNVMAHRFRDEVLAPSCNVVAVFSGHIHAQARGTFTDDCGRTVPHMLANYQSWANGGNGYLRTYEVDPTSMAIRATTYSPTLDSTLTDDRQTFTVQSERPAAAPDAPGDTVGETVIARGSTWNYFDRGAPPAGWNTPDFDDDSWKLGAGELGFGDGDETTTIATWAPDGQRLATAYFRHEFDLHGPGRVEAATIDLLADDGAVVWLNGKRVVSDNMPEGPIDHETPSSEGRWGSAEQVARTHVLAADAFVAGRNVLAIEVHQRERASSDLSFDAQVRVDRNPAVAWPAPDSPPPAGEFTAIGPDARWRYFDRGEIGNDWAQPWYDAGWWSTGVGQFGFGDGDETTLLNDRNDGRGLTAAYFRHDVELGQDITEARIELLADDGAVIWINGVVAVTDNMPSNSPAYDTLAIAGRWGGDEERLRTFTVPGSYFHSGSNTIAVEVHQHDEWSSDLSFALELAVTPR